MGGFISPVRTHYVSEAKIAYYFRKKNTGMIKSRRFQTNFNNKKSFRNSAVALCYHLYRRISAKKPLSATALNKIRHINYLLLEMDSTLAVSTVPPRTEKQES